MKVINLKKHAAIFLETYKNKGPATYAAAEQAIGTLLIADGFFGIESPFGQNKRPGIFGTIAGMFAGIIFMFVPSFIGNITNINKMTQTSPAIVTSVGDMVRGNDSNSSGTCTLAVSYIVNGKEYKKQSSTSSSDHCSLSVGQEITIDYDPGNPDSWGYKTNTIKTILKIFFWSGLFLLISSIFTFFIRLFSIIFGWKLLKDGRKNAAALPSGTNLDTMIDEIKKNFTSSIFNFNKQGDKN